MITAGEFKQQDDYYWTGPRGTTICKTFDADRVVFTAWGRRVINNVPNMIGCRDTFNEAVQLLREMR